MGFIRENFGTRNMHTLLICEYYVEYIEATHDMKLIGSQMIFIDIYINTLISNFIDLQTFSFVAKLEYGKKKFN